MIHPTDPSLSAVTLSPQAGALPAAPPPPPPPNATGNAIEANLAGLPLPPLPPSVPPLGAPVPPLDVARAQAMQFAMQSRQWIGQINQLASALGAHLGGSLGFAQRGVAQIDAALATGASAEQLHRLTNRLKGDWMVRGPAVFDRINHGVFRNAERGLRQAAVDLARAGVTGAPLQAYREAAQTLRGLEASGAPGNGSMLQFKAVLDQTMAKVIQASVSYAARHPEHQPALQQAASSAQTGINWMMQGLAVSESMRRTVGMGIGLPGPGPVPFPPGLPRLPPDAGPGDVLGRPSGGPGLPPRPPPGDAAPFQSAA